MPTTNWRKVANTLAAALEVHVEEYEQTGCGGDDCYNEEGHVTGCILGDAQEALALYFEAIYKEDKEVHVHT